MLVVPEEEAVAEPVEAEPVVVPEAEVESLFVAVAVADPVEDAVADAVVVVVAGRGVHVVTAVELGTQEAPAVGSVLHVNAAEPSYPSGHFT